MKSQIVKRININLTQKEIKALELLEEEMITRNTPESMSDIIRDSIIEYCRKQTGVDFNIIS